jgi:hypothetical protein
MMCSCVFPHTPERTYSAYRPSVILPSSLQPLGQG